MDRRHRVSLRQAVIVEGPPAMIEPADSRFDPEARRADLRRRVFLDVLRSLVAINGVTISVLATPRLQARSFAAVVPPGVDLVVPAAEVLAREGALFWAFRTHLERAFVHVVAVAGDTLALPARAVATGLSSLANADLVAGATPEGALFLLGVRDEVGLALCRESGASTGFANVSAAMVRDAAAQRRVTVRWVDRQSRLGTVLAGERADYRLDRDPGQTSPTDEWSGSLSPAAGL